MTWICCGTARWAGWSLTCGPRRRSGRFCAFTFGHVRQLDAAARTVLVTLSRVTPLLPGAGGLAYGT
jgi:hypothetical protein